MKADDKLQILKFFLMLVNSVFVILGISIFACSAWILFDKNNFISVLSSEQEVRVVAGGLFFIGLVVVGVSLLGCTGAYLENRCFIIFYLSFLIVIILGQIFITFVLLIRRQSIETNLTSIVDDIIKNYGGNETHTSSVLLDSVQRSAKCCGRLNTEEWRNNSVIWSMNGTNIFPCSCFNSTCPLISGSDRFGNGSSIYETGCEKVLRNWLDTNIIVIFGMEAGLLLIQVLQFIVAVHTYKCIGRKKTELHPDKLLNSMEENVSSESVHQQYSTATLQPQTCDLQMHSDNDHRGYDHSGGDDRGYDHSGGDDRGYDHSGGDDRGYNHSGGDDRGYNHSGGDDRGYDHSGGDDTGYDHSGGDDRGYDHSGGDDRGYNHSGGDDRGYDHSGGDDRGYDHSGGDDRGYDHSGGDDRGYDHSGGDHGAYNHIGYDNAGYDGYVPETYDQRFSGEFYEQDSSYNTAQNLEYHQSYSAGHDQLYNQNYHQNYNNNDYNY